MKKKIYEDKAYLKTSTFISFTYNKCMNINLALIHNLFPFNNNNNNFELIKKTNVINIDDKNNLCHYCLI